MSDFAFAIGERDAATNSVPVTFTVDGKAYTRGVTATATDTSDALMLRVLDVGRGVLNKIALGVLKDDATIAAEQAAMTPPEDTADDAA